MAEKNNQNRGLKKKALIRPIISYRPGKPGKPSKPTSKPKK